MIQALQSLAREQLALNVYSDNVKIDLDKLIGMVEKYVGSSATATNASIR